MISDINSKSKVNKSMISYTLYNNYIHTHKTSFNLLVHLENVANPLLK